MQPFPSIAAVAEALRDLNRNVEGECDVRLNVREGEPLAWSLKWGDSSFDTDHRGLWGASSVPGVVNGAPRRFSSIEVAQDLIAQCREMVWDGGE